MDFLKVRNFRKSRKPKEEKEVEDETFTHEEQTRRSDNSAAKADDAMEDDDDDDDDDFITNEVKRRLKELRRNSFMVLIPEEDEDEDDEEDEGGDEDDKCSSEWRDVVAEGLQWWGGFDAVYDKYCNRMLFFDRFSSHHLNDSGTGIAASPSTPSPRSATKKLSSPFRCLSLKKMDIPEEDTEHLQQTETVEPCRDLETAYVSQLCLTWEALHCQYTQLSHLLSCETTPPTTCYNHTAQQFQQFLVLLQRFIEDEPFQQGSRSELYARARFAMPKLLQAPKIHGSDTKEMEKDTEFMVLAEDLMEIMESAILTFNVFLKMDKKKLNVVTHLFGNHHMNSTTPLQLVQSSIEKKRVKAKELSKKTKGLRKKKSWPQTWEGVQLLFAAIDIKLASRVLRMAKTSKEHLLWCEEKMKKLDFSGGRLQRQPSPLLFPC